MLGGCAAVEQAAKSAGQDVKVPFSPGRTDASAEMTDVESFEVLEPVADGFRNYVKGGLRKPAEELLVERANLLTLTAPEMTVLVGGMRVLGTNADGSELGVFTKRPGTLSNDFFVNLLDMNVEWKTASSSVFGFANTKEMETIFEGHDRASGESKWKGSRVDLALRFELAAAGVRGGVCVRGFAEEVRGRLRGCVEQGDEPGPVRPELI